MSWSDVALLGIVLLTAPLWGPIAIYAALFLFMGAAMLVVFVWTLLIGLIEGVVEMWKKQTERR